MKQHNSDRIVSPESVPTPLNQVVKTVLCFLSTSAYVPVHIGRAMRKCVSGHNRAAKVQISLRICAVWSGLSLSVNIITGYHRLYDWRANARMIICACAYWSESADCACSKTLFRLALPNGYGRSTCFVVWGVLLLIVWPSFSSLPS